MMNIKRLVLLELFIAVLVFVVTYIACSAMAEEGIHVQCQTLEECMRVLQPNKHYLSDERAERLAKIIKKAGDDNDIDPKLITAIIKRESSFSREFEELRAYGKTANEIGLMQCHGAALKFRPFGCTKQLK